MKGAKPALALTATGFWLGNLSDEAQNYGPCELYGFSTGSFEEVYVPRPLSSRHVHLHGLLRWSRPEDDRHRFPNPR